MSQLPEDNSRVTHTETKDTDTDAKRDCRSHLAWPPTHYDINKTIVSKSQKFFKKGINKQKDIPIESRECIRGTCLPVIRGVHVSIT